MGAWALNPASPWLRLGVVLVTSIGLALGCSGTPQASGIAPLPTTPPDVPFLAFASAFENYASWTCIELDQPVSVGHLAGHRKVCVNHLASPGAKEWPKGTIFVKELPDGSGGTQVLAMVKRGAGYNPYGAVGWEWFELTPASSDVIRWRGYSPPEGENYGGVAGGGLCSPCHNDAAKNDYVYSFELGTGK